jgi:hypothetical protein
VIVVAIAAIAAISAISAIPVGPVAVLQGVATMVLMADVPDRVVGPVLGLGHRGDREG